MPAPPDGVGDLALPMEEADRIIPRVERLMMSKRFALQVATQDWHPPGHVSFASSHPGCEPYDKVELYGRRETVWPDHCVPGTPGAELYPGLPWDRVLLTVRCGSDPDFDCYSAFRSNPDVDGRRMPTGLAGFLKERWITDLYVCGIARDYCVRWTAMDGADAGFRVWFVWDATRPVDPKSDEETRRLVESKGVKIVESPALLKP